MKSKLLHQSCRNGTKIFFKAYMMVDEVIGNIKSVRKNIDSDFQVWYKQILDLAEKLGIVEKIYSQEDTHTEESLKHSQL